VAIFPPKPKTDARSDCFPLDKYRAMRIIPGSRLAPPLMHRDDRAPRRNIRLKIYLVNSCQPLSLRSWKKLGLTRSHACSNFRWCELSRFQEH